MKIGHSFILSSVAVGTVLGGASVANAQGADSRLPVALTYSNQHRPKLDLSYAGAYYATRRDTWNTVLLVSGIVLVVGVIQNDSTLAILGGAGVIVSLVQLNPSRFQGNSFARGLDLAKAGPVAFGFSPFGQFGAVPGDRSLKPAAYIAAKFKF